MTKKIKLTRINQMFFEVLIVNTQKHKQRHKRGNYELSRNDSLRSESRLQTRH